jgi:hypothetical protein
VLHRPVLEQEQRPDGAQGGLVLQPPRQRLQPARRVWEHVGVHEADEFAARVGQRDVVGRREAHVAVEHQEPQRHLEPLVGARRQRLQLPPAWRVVEHVDQLGVGQAVAGEQGGLVLEEVDPAIERHDDAVARRGMRPAQRDHADARALAQPLGVQRADRGSGDPLEGGRELVVAQVEGRQHPLDRLDPPPRGAGKGL